MSEITQIDTGFVILVGEGRRWDDMLYPTRQSAESMAALCKIAGASVKPAKRVWSLRRPRRPDWIIAEGEA